MPFSTLQRKIEVAKAIERRAEKMKYKRVIDRTMRKDEVENALLQYYSGYSLLNFAAVITDVLFGQSPLDKSFFGLRKGNVKQTLESLEKTKKRIINLSEDVAMKVYVDNREGLSKIADQIGDFIKTLSNISGTLGAYFPSLNLGAKARPASVPTQIALLWSLAIRDEKKSIHWEDCIQLFVWFQKRLEKAPYFNECRKVLEASRLKKQYGRQKKIKEHFEFWTGWSRFKYFPFFGDMPGRPHITVEYKDGRIILRPIDSIIFYVNKIRIVFDIDKTLLEKNIYIDGTKAHAEIKEYHSTQKREHSSLLLEIQRWPP